MKFHFSSIVIGIGQAIVLFAIVFAESVIVATFQPMLTEQTQVIIVILSFVVLFFITLMYPLYLFLKKRRSDAVGVFLPTAISICLVFIVLFPVRRLVSPIPMSESRAMSVIQDQFPALKDYPSDDLAPRSIHTEQADNGWYIAFVQEGSGRPIIRVQCYFVDTTEEVTSTGVFSPEDSVHTIEDISLRNCKLKESSVGGEPSSSSACSVENCHDFRSILCGSHPSDVCTEIYMIGDRCLQYARCGEENGTCQQILSAQFDECATCVQQCVDASKDDSAALFACESSCG